MTQQLSRPGSTAAEMQGLARGGMVGLAGAAVSALSGVGVALILTRTLSKGEAGIFFSLTSLVLIAATVARLGTPTGLVYFLSGGRALRQQGREREIMGLALKPVVVLSVVAALALAVAAPSVVRVLGVAGEDDAEAVAALRVLAAFVPLAALVEVFLSATRALGTMRPTVLIDRLGRCGAQVVLMLVAAATTGSLIVMTVAWAAPYLPALLAARQQFTARLAGTEGSPDSPAPSRSQFWRFTAPRSVSSLVQIALQRVDILLVAALLGPGEAAIYAAASRFVVLGQLGNQAVSLAAQPRLRMALARGDVSAAKAIYRTATGWLILLTWPPYLVAMLFAQPLLRLFGEGYEEGYVVVLVLSLAMLLATACGMVDMVLSMAGRTSWNLWNSLGALSINVVADLILIPRVGILGAAIGWALAITTNNLLPLVQIAWAVHVHPFGRTVAIAISLTSVSFAALPALGLLFAGRDGQLLGIGVGVCLFAGGCLVQRQALALGVLGAALRPRVKVRR